MGRVVDVIVTPGLEEKVARLPGGHRNQPADQSGGNRIDEQQSIGDQKAGGADEVQALVDPAVMVVAMVIPALRAQLLAKVLYHFVPQACRNLATAIRCKQCDDIKVTCTPSHGCRCCTPACPS
jgi:hypothetical protein